jgi:plasmid stabilization system protein ParE
MRRLRYSSKAHADVKEILFYISGDKPGAALKFVEQIETRCKLIANNPEMESYDQNTVMVFALSRLEGT